MKATLEITLVVEDHAVAPFVAEHGLAMSLTWDAEKILFDTGCGSALLPNLARLGIDPDGFRDIIISHGHNDHTGGIAKLRPRDIWYVPGISRNRYSLHPDQPAHRLTLPVDALAALKQCHLHEVCAFTAMKPGLWLTGPIPRNSGEDAGGPFFFDTEHQTADPIADEQALLTETGVLIQGCCHSGIINTLNYCRQRKPEIKIHTIIGGLHLKNSTPERLKKTAQALREFGIKQLYLIHCTGETAIDYLQRNLPECQIFAPTVGATLTF